MIYKKYPVQSERRVGRVKRNPPQSLNFEERWVYASLLPTLHLLIKRNLERQSI